MTKPRRVSQLRVKSSEDTLRYGGRDFFEAQHNMNGDFLDRGWGDGFPIVPPTPEAVEAMLRGTSRSRDEVVVVMDPGRGIATVDKIAVNSLMAGCRPEHLPVVIAAVEAVSEPQFNLPMISQSTGPHAPLLVINGPIRKELGINCGGCALGPGAPSRVNTAIGRALRLIMMNVGQAYPNVMDMDVIGSPNKYSMCVGENEESNPWGPLHVERGFAPDASTVTAIPGTSLHDVADFASYTPEDLLLTFAYTANGPTSTAWSWLLPDAPGWNRESLLVICPEHARIIANAGWTKDEIRLFMFHKTRIPLKFIKPHLLEPGKAPEWRWLLTQPDDMMVQVVKEPKAFHIVVVGASGPKSAYVDGMGEPVTKEIKR
ncbi:MAG: hypothetical protein HYX92_21800 [Chloroflexi bacterium]|nr:hypothetical protein [Chloroflexota bacterium]